MRLVRSVAIDTHLCGAHIQRLQAQRVPAKRRREALRDRDEGRDGLRPGSMCTKLFLHIRIAFAMRLASSPPSPR